MQQPNKDTDGTRKEEPLHDDNTSKMPDDGTPQSTEDVVRGGVGQGMNAFSDLVNNNLIAFRYGTVATVTLLTAYGIANTPLFFRYRSVAEIPGKRGYSPQYRMVVSISHSHSNICIPALQPTFLQEENV